MEKSVQVILNDINLYEKFNLIAHAESDGYTMSLMTPFENFFSDYAGSSRKYYWGADEKSAPFVINLATDGMTEIQLSELKKFLKPQKFYKLSYADEPFIFSSVLLVEAPSFKYISFPDGKNKGFLSLSFENLLGGKYANCYTCADDDEYKQSKEIRNIPSAATLAAKPFTGFVGSVYYHGGTPASTNRTPSFPAFVFNGGEKDVPLNFSRSYTLVRPVQTPDQPSPIIPWTVQRFRTQANPSFIFEIKQPQPLADANIIFALLNNDNNNQTVVFSKRDSYYFYLQEHLKSELKNDFITIFLNAATLQNLRNGIYSLIFPDTVGGVVYHSGIWKLEVDGHNKNAYFIRDTWKCQIHMNTNGQYLSIAPSGNYSSGNYNTDRFGRCAGANNNFISEEIVMNLAYRYKYV